MFGTRILVRNFSTSNAQNLKVAVIGQSQFGQEVYKALRRDGHEIVGVFTIPDKAGRPDPLAIEAEKDGTRIFKFPRWRNKANPILTDVFEQYKACGAELNVLPFCSQFIPMPVINHPKHKSIVYHPSILPRHRGASAINWTLMEGDAKAGFTVFWADDGLDTGPILLQKTTDVQEEDTVDSLYNRFMFPEGIKSMAEAVKLVELGQAPCIPQSEVGATYDPIWQKKEVAKVPWDKIQSAKQLHDFVRGNDKIPGAWAEFEDGEAVTFFNSSMWQGDVPTGDAVGVVGSAAPGIVHNDGLLLFAPDGNAVNIRQLQVKGKMIQASKYGKQDEAQVSLELTEDEMMMKKEIHAIWKGILMKDVADDTDFFASGAGSMDVTRLVEEVKEKCPQISLVNEDVYMATTFEEFVAKCVLVSRGGDAVEFTYDAVQMRVNNMDIKFPNQVFIDNQFVDAISGKKQKTINPMDESAICEVAHGGAEDVNVAVAVAKRAFEEGKWAEMNARDRGALLNHLADLMEEHQEELATIEAIDSGAVYTLALKTHVGMSIATFRYFAGWCDKIQGKTIPINNAKPNMNLTFTKREPLGVCGIVIPWNYPLMMLAWKSAACLAAGNTVVLKPAQVTPLTALKFAELVVKAGFPPGVVNIVPGSGSQVGQALCDHPDVRKVGFTGSTEIGKTIMQSCALSNVKKVSLELGGKSPLIIFSDCDLEKAVRMGMGAVFFNKGENCIAAGRLFVEDTVHDMFVNRVVEEIKKMKIGDPLDRSTAHGPQNHRAHFQKLLEFVDRGVAEGATLVYGGKQARPGLFLEPTVFTDVEDHMWIAEEESFGPIMIISKFAYGDVDGVIKRANATEFGLASGVFTKDIDKAMRVAQKIDAGTCFVNTYNKTDVAAPFGGFKQSGFGKDLGEEALNEYLKTKCVTVEYSVN